MLFIINKNARLGTTYKIFFKVLVPMLKRMRLHFGCRATETREEAIEVIRQAVEGGEKNIIVGGGDGAVNTALAPIVGKGITLGILPLGTANDFAAASLKIPLAPIRALKALLKRKRVPVDVAKANEMHFLNVFGLGIDANVTRLAHSHSFFKSLPVKELRYGLPLMQELAGFRPLKIELEIGGKKAFRGKVIQVGAYNGKREAAYFYFNKNGNISDGLLDIFVIEDMPLERKMEVLFKVATGGFEKLPGIHIFRTAEFNLRICQDIGNGANIQLDGEPLVLKSQEIKFSVIKHGIQAFSK